ncbi:MAG: aminoacyl-tRNA hydrolase [Chloroflexi bacterium]|nr:aminoacyl-tRNA hydrolase [Chloroflexota bacterium]
MSEEHLPYYLLVGLGNPGQRYRMTRHNIGFRCIDHLAERHQIAVTRKRFAALLGEGTIAGERVVLAKPQTFMNESGKAVQPIMRWWKIPPEHILVIYDDLDIPLGRLRLRADGSSGGHRGINSIIAETSSPAFNRLRIGIGRPIGDAIDHVLNGFSAEEKTVLDKLFEQLDPIVDCFLREGLASAMNRYNSLNLAVPPADSAPITLK